MLLLGHDPHSFDYDSKTKLRRAVRMTIAAAIYCTDGVVVCADSEETEYTKRNQGKIRAFKYEDETYVFTGAGDADLLEVAMEDIVESRRHRKKIHSYEWKVALKRDAAQIFKDYVEPCSGFRDHERVPQMSMIASIQVDGQINIFRIRDTIVRKIKPLEHVSVGAGNMIATGLIDRHLKNANLTMKMTARIGAYILEHVKKSVPGCGGYTHFFLQGVDGSLNPGYASAWGAGMSALDAATTSLIYTTLETDDAMFGKAIENLVQQVKNARAGFKPDGHMLRWMQFIEAVPPPVMPSTSRRSKRAR